MMLKKRLALTSAALLALFAAGLRADVLERLPAESLVATKVANLEKTNAKLQKVITELGIDQFQPEAKDPLAATMKKLGIEKGLNKSGELGAAVLPGKADGDEPVVLLLIPVSSFDEFVSNFPDAQKEEGATRVRFKDAEEDVYLADWGEYAAMSDKPEATAKPANVLKLPAFSSKEAGRHDLFVFANIPAINNIGRPELDKGFGKLLAEIDKPESKISDKYKPLVRAGAKQVFGVLTSFLRDADGATYGWNISDGGFNGTIAADFKPDSYLAKFASAIKNTDKSLTVGLPSERYHAFGGSSIDPAPLMSFYDDLTKPVADELEKLEGLDQVKSLVAQARTAMSKSHGGPFGAVGPRQGMIFTDPLNQSVNITHGGADEWMKTINDTGALAKDLLAQVPPEKQAQAPDLITDAEPVTVGDVKLQTWMLEMPKGPNGGQAQMLEALQTGKVGMRYNFGKIGDNDLIFASMARDEVIADFIKAAREGKDIVGDLAPVKATRAELPKSRFFEGYIAVDQVIVTGVSAAGAMGMVLPLELPPDLAPVGFTAASDGSVLRIDVHIPRSTVSAITAAMMQLYQQMSQPKQEGQI